MRRFLAGLCVATIFLGLHTGISLAPGGNMIWPFALCGVAAMAISILYFRQATSRAASGFVFFGAIVCLLIAIAMASGDGALQRVASSVLLVYSVWIGYAAFVGLNAMGLRKTSRMFMMLLLVLIVGSLLELYGGVKPLSDAFRRSTNSWRWIYDSDVRDLSSYGGLRPNFFASEPSVLGIIAGYSLLFWFLSASHFRSRRLALAMVLSAFTFLVIRSPTMLVCTAAVVIFYLSEWPAGYKVSRARCTAFGIGALIAIVLVPSIIAANTEYGQTGSFLMRTLGPAIVAKTVLQDFPLFGVGLGGREVLMKEIISGYSSSGAFAQFPYLLQGAATGTMSTNHLITNQFWEFWIYFGLVGGALIIFALWHLLGKLGVPNRFLVLCTSALIMTTSGGINVPMGWVGLFSIAVLYRNHWFARKLLSAQHPRHFISRETQDSAACTDPVALPSPIPIGRPLHSRP